MVIAKFIWWLKFRQGCQLATRLEKINLKNFLMIELSNVQMPVMQHELSTHWFDDFFRWPNFSLLLYRCGLFEKENLEPWSYNWLCLKECYNQWYLFSLHGVLCNLEWDSRLLLESKRWLWLDLKVSSPHLTQSTRLSWRQDKFCLGLLLPRQWCCVVYCFYMWCL